MRSRHEGQIAAQHALSIAIGKGSIHTHSTPMLSMTCEQSQVQTKGTDL